MEKELKEIKDKLVIMDDKLQTLVTQRVIQEYRIQQLEEAQKGAIKFSITALLTTVGTVISLLGKFIFDKLGGL